MCNSRFWADVGIIKWSPFFLFRRPKCNFLHLKMDTFGKSAQFQVPKNGTSGSETKKQRPLPQKMETPSP